MKNKILIDLNSAKLLSEAMGMVQFGAQLKHMLYNMLAEPGESFHSFIVRGTKGDVALFAAALMAEKKYMESYIKNGLNDPSVTNNRYRLDNAVSKFEKETGIKWPFK